MNLFWSPRLVARFEGAADSAEAIRLVGGLLVAAGAVTAGHVEEAIRRELSLPTALPAAIPFALVHTDAPGALKPAAAIGIFERPVPFGRMDDPSQVLPVRLVAMLSVPERSRQAETLSGLIRTLADAAVAERLLSMPARGARRLLVEKAA